MTSINNIYAIIKASGSYIPQKIVRNADFQGHTFYDANHKILPKSSEEIIHKFEQITGILERRYIDDSIVTSDMATSAAQETIENAQIDPESIDCIIVAHNFGDVKFSNKKSDAVPCLAARVKNNLNIVNSSCIAYDITFGCAGWLQAVIQANIFIKSGLYKRILVIGAESLSRVCDPHDRDSMIYADGAAAILLEAKQSEKPIGIITHVSKTLAVPYATALRMEETYVPKSIDNTLYLKMDGHKLYEQVLKNVPAMMKECLELSNISVAEVDHFLIHQANQKMDEAILERLFLLDGISAPALEKMPMTISFLGNTSVASIPTLYDLIAQDKFGEYKFQSNEKIILTAVGAGINMNCMLYIYP